MWIKEIVDKLIKKYGTRDPYEIASALNIYVIEFNLHDDVMGFYRYLRRSLFIYINANLSDEEKILTIAHELGHVILHSKTNTPFLKSSTLLSIDKIEQEANRFAVELLLPDDAIYQYEDTNMTINEIAGIYGVPDEVAHLKKF